MDSSSGRRMRGTAGSATISQPAAERRTGKRKRSSPIPNSMHTASWLLMSDSRAIDQESRRLIRTELLTNILLEAGAGSGKTQMLAERMAAGVAAGVYNVEHMAAGTFTRKAASELRGRFHLALEGELSKSGILSLPEGVQQQRTARVQSALSNLERFFGGTIHSFCARLLRERPVESGVSPGFTELDEVQDLQLRSEEHTSELQ